jgi:hypothetical protein
MVSLNIDQLDALNSRRLELLQVRAGAALPALNRPTDPALSSG